MLQFSLLRSALLFVSVALVSLAVGCREGKQTVSTGERHPTPSSVLSSPDPATPKDTERVLAASNLEPNLFELGLNRGAGAYSISQTAKSGEDWQLVAGQYQDAIALLKQVDPQNSGYAIAQSKISEYQRRIQLAQQKMVLRPQITPSPTPKETITVAPQIIIPTKSSTPSPPPKTKVRKPPATTITQAPIILNSDSTELLTQQTEVYTVPIKRRAGGTPVIEVTFNGKQKFEMIVDTGASGTVITQSMAAALPVVAVGKAKANTASSKSVEFPIGYVNSMEVGGVQVNRVAVAIAGAELETGLLGHDFFGDYDITIKQNVVEFRPHLQTSNQTSNQTSSNYSDNSSRVNSLENRPAVPIYPKPRH
jgi:predicted aspartyl protease